MPRTSGKKRLAALLALAGLLTHLTACGTILHPERRGQPSGRLDPAIVALDAVGLLLFFIPGVIAFAVDFSNGTIYLPDGGSADARPLPGVEGVQTVRLSPAELTPDREERGLRALTRRPRIERGIADGAEQHRVGVFHGGDGVGRQRLIGGADRRAADQRVHESEVMSVTIGDFMKHARRRRGDVRADAVTAEKNDAGVHTPNP